MIISVSDVHLGEDGYRDQDDQFSKFLDFVRDDALKNGGHLVLLGDIFDFWRKDSAEILEKYGGIIKKLFDYPDTIEIHYIIGNHDFYMSEVPKYFGENPFKSFGSTICIKDRYTFRFIHGYQLEVMANPYTKDMNLYESLARRLSYHSGLTGNIASGVWHAICTLTKDEGDYLSSMVKDPSARLNGKNNAENKVTMLAKSGGRGLLLGSPFDWLVYGHTHNPFIDPESRTVNTGSWGRSSSQKTMSYLKIDRGTPELIEWENE